MRSKATDWVYLAREGFLLLACAYVIILGGGFSGLVDFRLQAFSTFLAILVLGAWLIIRLLAKSRLPASGVDRAILLFLLSQFVAVVLSEDPRRSLPHAVVWLAYVFVFCFVVDLLRRDWPQELFFKSMMIVGAIILVFAVIDLALIYNRWRSLAAGLEFAPSFQQRLSTILGDPNLLAALSNLLFPLSMANLLIAKSKAVRLGMSFYLITSLMVLYFTDSRGGLLGIGAAVGTFLLLWVLIVSESARAQVWKGATWIWQRKVLLLVLIVALFSAIGFISWRFLSFEGSTTHGRVVDARDIYWQAATDALKADPVSGAGPGMYPIYLMKIWSTPPARPYLHAHSFPFQVAAESGLLGLAALAILVFAIARRASTCWRGLDASARARWAAAVAGLVGLAAHSLVDDFFPFPAVGLTAFVYLAFVLRPTPPKEKVAKFSPWLLAAPGLAAATFAIYGLNAYWHADKAVILGSEGNWGAAAAEMQTAANADPGVGLYWLQTGYAYGRLAEADPEFMDEAIGSYEKGIQIEPEYALNRANLASLLWSASYQQEALHQMRIATSMAPGAWLLLINQGVYEEQMELGADSMASYGLALNFRPEIVGAEFWKQSELRARAAQIATETAIQDDPGSGAALVAAAREKVRTSEFAAARSLLAEAHSKNDQDIRLYVGLGELALATGDLDLAEQYMQAALWIQVTNNQAKVEAVLLGAEISLASGDREEALRRFELAYLAILADTSYGWGSYGWSPYAWFVFQRRAFPEDLLPQLERADISTTIAARLLPLVDLYEEMGETQKAQEVLAALSPYLP